MKSVFVSAGHSDTDPGAVAFGRKEADIAVEFRNMVAFYLQRESVPHELDGKGTQNLPLRWAAAQAMKHPIAVEFHCNAAANSTATGVETLAGPKNMTFAGMLSGVIAEALRLRDRGAKPENSGQHSRLAFVQAGGIIVELMFITNAADLAAYDARKWLAAKAVAELLEAKARS